MAYEHDRFEGEDRGGAFLMGLLAGTVLGAGLGMLFAPKKGSEIRSQITDSASRLQRTASETIQEAGTRVNQIVEKGRETYDQLVSKGREAYEKGREVYQQTREAATRPESGMHSEPRMPTGHHPTSGSPLG